MPTAPESANPFGKWRKLLLNLPGEREVLRTHSAYKTPRNILTAFFWMAVTPAVLVFFGALICIAHPDAFDGRAAPFARDAMAQLLLVFGLFFYLGPLVVGFELAQAFFDIADAALSNSSREGPEKTL